jgi:hypothetical protein
MSTLRIAFLAITFLGLLLASCEKDSLGESPVPTTDESVAQESIELDDVSTTDEAITQLPKVVDVNGLKTLAFNSNEHFDYILRSISHMNSEELNNWEATLGFTSMRNEFEQIEAIYDEIRSKRELDNFMAQYADQVYFQEETGLEIPIGMYHVGSLVNNEGIVKIAGALQMFTRERVITILDGDYEKLSSAKSLDNSNEEENIFISSLTRQSTRLNGPDLLTRTSLWDDDNHRIIFSAKIISWSGPNYVDIGGILVWAGTFELRAKLELEAKSQKKILGIPFGHKTDIDITKGTNVTRELYGSLTSYWMPFDESDEDVKKLVVTEDIHPTIDNLTISPTYDYCFGTSALLGELATGPSTRLWN